MRRLLQRSSATMVLFVRNLKDRQLEEFYYQEAFESMRRFKESKTYPGSIKAATPGDTQTYAGTIGTILPTGEKHYWRPVTDDPQVQHLIPLRVRFAENVWVTSKWELRMHVISLMMPRDATIQEVIDQVELENQSPYLCLKPFSLAVDGKELDPSKTLEDYHLNELSQIDAVDPCDHLRHTPEEQRLDWNVDQIPEETLGQSPYKEIVTPVGKVYPRFEWKPRGLDKYGPVRKL